MTVTMLRKSLLDESQKSVRRAISAATIEAENMPDHHDVPCMSLRRGADHLGYWFMLKNVKQLLMASEAFYPLDYRSEQFYLACCVATWDFDSVKRRLARRIEKKLAITDLMQGIAGAVSSVESGGVVQQIKDLWAQLKNQNMKAPVDWGPFASYPDVPESVLRELSDEWTFEKIGIFLSLLKLNSLVFNDKVAGQIYDDIPNMVADPSERLVPWMGRMCEYLRQTDWIERFQAPASEGEIESWEFPQLVEEGRLLGCTFDWEEALRLASMAEERNETDCYVTNLRAKALYWLDRKSEMKEYLQKKQAGCKGTEWEEAIGRLLGVNE